MDEYLGNHDSSVNNVDVEVVKNDNCIESHECNQCNCATSNKGHLSSHLQMHTGENQTNTTCVNIHPTMQAH